MEPTTAVLVCEVDVDAVDGVVTELFAAGATAVVEAEREDGRVELRAGFESEDGARAASERIAASAASRIEADPTHAWAEHRPGPKRAVRAGRFEIAAPGHEPRPEPDDAVVSLTIEPGRAFGHGGHPTTALLLEMLDGLVTPGATVVDVGTGTGILAIAAATLGARVQAIEIDAQAREVAHDNVARNGVAERVDISATLPEAVDADVALVNLTLDGQRAVAGSLGGAGVVAVSGILDHQVPDLLDLHRPRTPMTIVERDGWAAVTLA